MADKCERCKMEMKKKKLTVQFAATTLSGKWIESWNQTFCSARCLCLYNLYFLTPNFFRPKWRKDIISRKENAGA